MEGYNSIIKGLNEAVDYENGKLKNVQRRKVTFIPVNEYRKKEIKDIREALNLSQFVFSCLLGVSVKTVEAWESGRNTPNGPTLRLLDVLKNDNSIIERYIITES